ncbi:unnamed protein product [Mytilus coruscus]|uniref:CLIP3_4 n=1 Tax=Mytilus coruscus TaxID=42192 RepID=A0A6J8B4H5_MYTCO|nr:CLIP3_4 [Mytilus coruscus]CAC5377984.1 unnamed protein product [Mytilus coruscus]
MASYSNKRIPIPEGKAKEKRRSFLPAPKTFGLQKEKQEEPRLFSPPPEDHADEELHVGDRVVISGVKAGTLLYFGKTHIASGFWCGIELDEPDGKHDGSVEGVRYFECRVGHGIFAPADRVSKPEGSVEDTTETLRHLPQPKTKVRRLLPQPKAFNKPENTESLLRSKILEEQEEFQYRSESPRIAQQQKAHYQQDYLYDRSNLNIDDLLTEQYGDSCVKKLSSTFTLSEGSRRSESEYFTHKSPRRSQNYGHQQYQGQGCVSTELEVTGNALNNTYILPTEKIEQLNRIYTDSGFILPSEKIEQLNRTHNDSGSSGDDSIGPELKECLSSDGRKYFNLTFDTEGNNSPKHLSHSRNSDKIHHEISNECEVKTTPVSKSNQMSESMSSSLGVLDLEDVLFQTELLTDDLVDSSNLTDIEKIVQSCDKTKRVASLNDTFENKSVITSTPLVTEKSKSLLDRTRTISNSKSGISTDIHEEVGQLSDQQILQNLRHNLNSTFQADQTRGVELPIVGDDTLDWRQEASDSEEQQSDDSLEDSYSKNVLRGYNEKGNLNATYTYGLDSNTNSSRNDSLSEKLENLRLDKEDSIQGNKELSFQKVQSGLTREQIQKFDKPMTDSGISVKGLTDSTNSLQSSTEGIIYRQRKPMTDSGISLQSDNGMADSQEMRWSQNLDSLQELTENSGLEEKQFGDPTQLERDLKAGHKKRDRPLSLISTTSADTVFKTKKKNVRIKVGSFGDGHIGFIPPLRVGSFGDDHIGFIPPLRVGSFGDDHIGFIPPLRVGGSVGSFGDGHVGFIPPLRVGSFGDGHIGFILPLRVGSFGDGQIGFIPPLRVGSFGDGHIGFIPPLQVGSFGDGHIGFIPPLRVGGFGDGHVGFIPPLRVGSFGDGHVGFIPPLRVGSFGDDHIGFIPPLRVGSFGDGHIGFIPPLRVGSFVGSFGDGHIGFIPPLRVGSFGDGHVGFIPPLRVGSFGDGHVGFIPPLRVGSFGDGHIGFIPPLRVGSFGDDIGFIPPLRVGGFDDGHIGFIPPLRVGGFDDGHIGFIRPLRVGSFDDGHIGFIPPLRVGGFGDGHIGFIPPLRVGSFGDGHIGFIPPLRVGGFGDGHIGFIPPLRVGSLMMAILVLFLRYEWEVLVMAILVLFLRYEWEVLVMAILVLFLRYKWEVLVMAILVLFLHYKLRVGSFGDGHIGLIPPLRVGSFGDGHIGLIPPLRVRSFGDGHIGFIPPLQVGSFGDGIKSSSGYVPDTDSEVGTVTMNSPTEWTDSKTDDHKVTDLDQAYAETFKHYQSAVLKGTRRARDLESDSDMYSDAGTIIADTDTLREISSDIDIICGSLSEAKEVLSEQVPSLDLEKAKVQTPAPTDENVEDERIEADQQLDPLGGKNQEKESAKAEIPQVNIEIVDQDGTTTTTTDEKKDEDVETDANKESSKTPRKMTPKKKELEKSDYKKPKVASRLADYINQPVPELSEEEKLERAKNRKNKFQKNVVKKVEKEDKNTSHSEERHKKVEKEPPKIIKRTPPKSKWDAVMNKIENNQSAPPKPKTEVKSKLQEYLSAPTPVKKETEIKPPKKVSNMPTPDYSKIKSKLNLAAPPPVAKKIDNKKKSKLPGPGNLKRHSSVSSNASSLMKLDLNDSVGSSSQVFGSALTSARSSCSDLHKEVYQDSKSHDRPSNPSVGRLSMPGKRERRDSTSSTISNISQGSSSRPMTDRSNKVGERVSLRRQSMPVKSSIPPPTDLPRKSSVASRINTGTNKVNKTLTTIKDLPSPTKRDTNYDHFMKKVKEEGKR